MSPLFLHSSENLPPFDAHRPHLVVIIGSGNLSTKSLVGIVSKEHVVVDSEYLETLFVAVPK